MNTQKALVALAQNQHSEDLVLNGTTALQKAIETGEDVEFYVTEGGAGTVRATPTGDIVLSWNGLPTKGNDYFLKEDGCFHF